MMIVRHFFLGLAAAFLVGHASSLAATPEAEQSQSAFEQQVRPFLAKHCFSCHGPNDGKAGLTLHHLGVDFTVGDHGDLWKEVIDRINVSRSAA